MRQHASIGRSFLGTERQGTTEIRGGALTGQGMGDVEMALAYGRLSPWVALSPILFPQLNSHPRVPSIRAYHQHNCAALSEDMELYRYRLDLTGHGDRG